MLVQYEKYYQKGPIEGCIKIGSQVVPCYYLVFWCERRLFRGMILQWYEYFILLSNRMP